MAKRRRGARSAPPRPSLHRPFESLVAVALDAIPEPFASALDEVAVVIADDPTPEQRRENDIGPDETLYGLYEGVPRTAWGADWVEIPNRITLFRLPLEEDFADRAVWDMNLLSRDKHVMPWRIEDEMKRIGANFMQAGLWRPFATRDGNLITGQQNFSGAATAELLVRTLGR
jgi:predicted Zn-dependent protease with MMP-like domain